MNKPAPARIGDALDWLHEQGKRRAESVPELDVEEALLMVRIAGQLDAPEQDQDHLDAGTISGSTPRGRVAAAILELGPSTAAKLGVKLGLTSAAVRRHLDRLVSEGLVEAGTARTFGNRGCGRPVKLFAMTDAGRSAFEAVPDAESGKRGTSNAVLRTGLEMTRRLEDDGSATVRVRGELDISVTDQAYAYLRDVVDKQAGRVTIDLAELTFCDASGLGVLARVVGYARRSGCPLQLTAARPALLRIMHITGMAEALPGITSLVAADRRTGDASNSSAAASGHGQTDEAEESAM